MKKQGITLRELAKLAGVSDMTISRALNGQVKEKYSKASQRAEFIRNLAAEHGYQPNASARAIRNKRFNMVTFLSRYMDPWQTGYMPQLVLRGVLHELNKHGIRMALDEIPDAKLTDPNFMPNIFRELSVDGMIVSYIHSIPENTVNQMMRLL